jgi:hypothetical protein
MQNDDLLQLGYKKSPEGTYFKRLSDGILIEFNASIGLAIKVHLEVLILPKVESITKLIQVEQFLIGAFILP